MLIASLVISVVANIGGDPNFYQAESWQGATHDEMVTCAEMARDLNDGFDYQIRQGLNKGWQSKSAYCELIAVDDDSAEGAERTAATTAPKPVSYTF